MNNLEKEESLICEALVREIQKAKRWSAIIQAWHSLLHVRLMASTMKEEAKHLNNCPNTGKKRLETSQR